MPQATFQNHLFLIKIDCWNGRERNELLPEGYMAAVILMIYVNIIIVFDIV